MVVGEVGTRTDILVIGAGPGGYAAALRCADRGKQVALVERDQVGGACLNVGCIPSKVLIHSAEIAALPADSASLGVEVSTTVDMTRVQAHMGKVVAGLRGGVQQLLDAAGVEVVTGTARFARPQRVVVSEGQGVRHIEFDQCILATGSRPVELAGLPFDGERIIDSTGAVQMGEVPEHLVVVGAGYIGVELGTAFAKLGSRVTMVEARERVLPELDIALGRVVARRLRELGVEVVTGAYTPNLTDDGLVVTVDGEERTIPADRVLVAVGRRPNTDDLGLDIAHVPLDERGLIVVDASRRATRHVLAIGDITAGPALAHKATAEADVAAATACGEAAAFDPATIPAVVFSDPEVVTVGLTVDEARADGIDPTTFRFPLGASARARTLDRPLGQGEIIADEAGTVVGLHLVGVGVSELAGEAALAIEMATTLDDLAATIHPHPTLSEALPELALGALGHPLHVHRR
ncbi:MAG: dihydrolipoyl dehydrogenase [Actinomycetia bacterium]|nr:dihydrolipoyl dehydrogenase [Actinomycetes bacterium]